MHGVYKLAEAIFLIIGKSRFLAVANFTLALLAVGVLCTCAAAQENSTDYWVTKAKDFRLNGSTEEAISAFDRALQIDPANETVWTYKALELQILGRDEESVRAYEKALSLLDEKLKTSPNDAEAWMRKGRALSSLGRQDESNQAHEKALEIFNQRVEIKPKNATAWRYMAEVLMNLGRWDEGLQALNKVTEIDPGNLAAWERKGEFLTLMSRTNESLQTFDRSLELIPEEDTRERALVWMAKAQSLSYADRKEETLAALDEVTELDPGYVVAWRTKGYLLAELGRQNESVAAFDEAIKIDSEDALTWSEKASQLVMLKRYNESLPAFERALELTPETDAKDQAKIWAGKGDALNKTGRQTEAQSAFEWSVKESDRALSSDANDTTVLELKGRALLKLGRHEEALKSFERSIAAAAPGSFRAPNAWIGKGDALRARGENEAALEAYNQAIDLSPIYADAGVGRGESQEIDGPGCRGECIVLHGQKAGVRGVTPGPILCERLTAIESFGEAMVWKRRKTSEIIKAVAGAKLALTLLALAALCTCVTAQENTTVYWMGQSRRACVQQLLRRGHLSPR